MNVSRHPKGDRRQFHRFPLRAPARIYSGDRQWESEMIDISLKGILLVCPDDWSGELNSSYRIEIELPGGVYISMSITLVHENSDELGATCEKIDFDSFTHLKRIIELNLGDAALLNRELSALG